MNTLRDNIADALHEAILDNKMTMQEGNIHDITDNIISVISEYINR